MEDLEEVRARMRQKKQPQVLTDKSFRSFYRIAMTSMVCLAIGLAVSCYCKSHPEVDIVSYIEQHIFTILPSFEFKQPQTVSSNVMYEQIATGIYQCEDEKIRCLDDGIVQAVDNNQIIILYQNGVKATYSNLASTLVKAYDRIENNEVIATYEQQFALSLIKNNQEVSLIDVFN